MNRGEHRRMAEVEDAHFWYRGLRDLLVRTLTSAALPPRPRVLDVGCGTGANLRAIGGALRTSYLGGFDLSTEALALARLKAPEADLYQSDLRAPGLRMPQLDLVTCLDVLYVPGVAGCIDGLATLVDALAPGGHFVMQVPAYEWLYSEHDVAVHGTERYTAGGVRRLLAQLGLEPLQVTYRLCGLFPLAVLSRLPRMLGARRRNPSARSDLHSVPGPALNEALYRVLAAENRVLVRGVALPFGTSVFAVARRPT
ncbi:MAG: class I SAM-dependent methyltransferase [Sandaracinaceae bacterium]